MARLASEQRYPTDLTDAQWALAEPELTTHIGPGSPTKMDLRQMVNGILYLTRPGSQWRMLPRDYGYWGTVRQPASPRDQDADSPLSFSPVCLPGR